MNKKIVALAMGSLLLSAATSQATPACPMPALPMGKLQHTSTIHTGIFDEGAAEIVAHDADSQRIYVVNGDAKGIDVMSIADPNQPSKLFSLELENQGSPNSVAVHNGLVAVAVAAPDKTEAGQVLFFSTDGGESLGSATVGALPDMLTFSKDGSKVLVANEGEPNDDYSVDPEGSISIVDISGGLDNPPVQHATFTAFNGTESDLRSQGVRIFGPGASAAQDLEPEYIALSADGQSAWVTLQENNALARLDIGSATISGIYPLGYKDYGQQGNSIDASNKDDAINLRTYANVYGMYQPDALATFSMGCQEYIITANEGDSRDYDTFSEEARVKDIELDPTVFPAGIEDSEVLGRLNITTTLGDADGDGLYEKLYSYGGRSFSIWQFDGQQLHQVFDSGDEIAQLLAADYPDFFNSNNDDNDSFDSRSDDKGTEPEGVTVGYINNIPHAFIGLERMGGILVYSLSNPAEPTLVQYINNRNFNVEAEQGTIDGTAGDLAPEGLAFVSPGDSPNDQPLLLVANEVSGTTSLYTFKVTGDLDLDGDSDYRDLHKLVRCLGKSASHCPAADLNQDGRINGKDMGEMIRLIRQSRWARWLNH